LRRSAALFFATANVLGTSRFAHATQPPQLYDYSILNHVVIDSINTALPLNSPPINGFVPQVVFGLTTEQDKNDLTFSAVTSNTPGGFTMPKNSPPYYSVAIFDSGSSSHIISYPDTQIFNFPSATRDGDAEATLIGASGEETADVTDAIGVYFT